jgi:hypothetical protein
VDLKHSLQRAGFAVTKSPRLLDARDLRALPSTWAHRLAFGRDARALYLQGRKTIEPGRANAIGVSWSNALEPDYTGARTGRL